MIMCFSHTSTTYLFFERKKYYLLFLLAITTQSLYMVLFCSSVLSCQKPNRSRWFVANVIVIVVSGFAAIMVGYLLIYHVYLLCVGQTTNENVREVFKSRENPFDIGFNETCKYVCCRKAEPTLLPDLAAIVNTKDEYQRVKQRALGGVANTLSP